jgi:hypothetical protein
VLLIRLVRSSTGFGLMRWFRVVQVAHRFLILRKLNAGMRPHRQTGPVTFIAR